jgi:hypothetical protein
VQVFSLPLQAPPQPMNLEPGADFAVSVTDVGEENHAEHLQPQLMPAGHDVTLPLPRPHLVTVNWYDGRLNLAVTYFAWFMYTVQVFSEPLQAPDQCENVDPSAGLAVSVTDVFEANDAVHVEPQSMPAGDEMTLPVPGPLRLTSSG